jgi:hypothetical protein
MSDDRATAEGKVARRRGAGQRRPVETTDNLEALAADLTRQLGPTRARYLAALIDEAAEAAETRQ